MRYLLACLSLNYEGEEIQTRTFDRDRWYIASTFQADIDFDPHLKQYYLANPDYTSYYVKAKTYTYEVIPCFLRMFESRWYLICEYLNHKATRVLALERMQPLVIGEKEGLPSPNITPAYFYQDCFGIIRDDKQPEKIILKIYGNQADYIRSVPLHSSQEEPEATLDYEIFQLSRHFGLNY